MRIFLVVLENHLLVALCNVDTDVVLVGLPVVVRGLRNDHSRAKRDIHQDKATSVRIGQADLSVRGKASADRSDMEGEASLLSVADVVAVLQFFSNTQLRCGICADLNAAGDICQHSAASANDRGRVVEHSAARTTLSHPDSFDQED